MSVQPEGVQVKVVASVPEPGVIATELIEGAVFNTTTALLTRAVPLDTVSTGVTVQTRASPLLKKAPLKVCVVAPIDTLFTDQA